MTDVRRIDLPPMKPDHVEYLRMLAERGVLTHHKAWDAPVVSERAPPAPRGSSLPTFEDWLRGAPTY